MVDSNAPMPWMGVYAAVASLIWTLALMADFLHSLRRLKIWFPCRYSALNGASLIVLGIAVKFSMDLTTPMPGTYDQAAKSISTAFLCASTTHFMPSLGSMSDRDILVSLTALAILIVTLTVNVIIQVFTGVIENYFQAVVVFMNVYALIILSSSALTVSTSKRNLEHKCNELHKRISAEELQGDEIVNFEKLELILKKYWVVADTGNPQFVMARSDASGVLFLICSSIFISDGSVLSTNNKPEIASVYKWSVYLVYWTQFVGMCLCFVMSFGRCLVAIIHTARNIRKCTISSISLEINKYRIKRLVEWKKRLPPLQVRGRKLRKFIYYMRNLLLNICIGSQIVIVIVNNLLVPISVFGALFLKLRLSNFCLVLGNMSAFILFFCMLMDLRIIRCWPALKKFFLMESKASVNPRDVRNFVSLLESEGIQDGYLMFINTSFNSSIMMGAKHQPRHLMVLMEYSTSFEGVLKSESDRVSPIICKEPLNCWSLSVATLTSIIIALPNVQNEKRNQFMRSVIEGFTYVRLMEKSLDVHRKLVSSTSAADFLWVGVELVHKWLDEDLQKISRVSKSSKETIQNLANRSEEILKEYTSKTNGNAMESSINLPKKVIIANSMYKISSTLLLAYDDEESYDSASDTQVFERLSVVVADIFAACLTNVPHVILNKCNNCAIEKREKSILEATHLLGETQAILKALQKHEIPNLSLDQSIYIDEWRALLEHTIHGISDPTSSSENIITGDVHLNIQQLRATSATAALETDEGNAESHLSREAEESRDESRSQA